MRTGELLIGDGLIKDEDIRMALEIQERHNREKIPPLIGAILCQWNMVTPLDLFLTLHKHGKLLKVGDILLREGKVHTSQLAQALSFQDEKSKPFGEILVEKKFTSELEVYHALANQGNIPFLPLDDFSYQADEMSVLVHFTGFDLISEKKIVPLEYCNDTLTLAILAPADMHALNTPEFENVMFRIKCVLISKEKHHSLLSEFWEKTMNDCELPGAGSSLRMPLIIIRDPDSETVKIDAMFHRYNCLKNIPGQIGNAANVMLFREFIRENHEKILNQFQCAHVSYQLEKRDGRILVQAFPATAS